MLHPERSSASQVLFCQTASMPNPGGVLGHHSASPRARRGRRSGTPGGVAVILRGEPRPKEAPPGFEPGNEGFADPCLTTWRWRRSVETTGSSSGLPCKYTLCATSHATAGSFCNHPLGRQSLLQGCGASIRRWTQLLALPGQTAPHAVAGRSSIRSRTRSSSFFRRRSARNPTYAWVPWMGTNSGSVSKQARHGSPASDA